MVAGFNSEGQIRDFDLNKVKETIQVETDRDVYFAHENILFAVSYFINESRIEPAISTVLYVELINCRNNEPVIQKKIKLAAFSARGVLKIPQSVPTGTYALRVYTQYQRNFAVQSYNHRFLTILNSEDDKNYLPVVTENDSVEIAPEGNILLDNIQNTVVVMVPEAWLTADNRYYVVDDALQVLEELTVPETGILQMEFTGNHLQNYYFLLLKSNGDSIVTAFPGVQPEGIQTGIRKTGNSITYSIHRAGMNSVSVSPDYRLKAYRSDFMESFDESIKMNGNTFETQMAIENLAKGMNYLVLSDASGNILRVNSVFIQPSINEVGISGLQEAYSRRDMVKVQLEMEDRILEKDPLVTISVTRHKTKKEDYIPNLSLYLNSGVLLNSFLQFNSKVDNTLQEQAMILFDKKLNKQAFEENIKKTKSAGVSNIPEINDVSLRGIIRNKETLTPVAGRDIYASVLFNNPQLHVCKSKEDGEFIFSLNNVNGTTEVFLCPENTDNQAYEILITNPFSGEFPELGDIPTFIEVADTALINELYKNIQIREHFHPMPEPEAAYKERSHSFNIDNNKLTVNLADFVSLKNMEELFTEIVPTVKSVKHNNNYTFSVFDENGNVFSQKPLVLLDRIPVFDLSKIMHLDISLVKKVEVINTTYILGENTFQGVVMISTNTSDFAGIEFPESSVFIEYPAIEKTADTADPETFYSEDRNLPDFRTTLYWKAGLRPDANEFSLSFFTSDNTGVFDVEVKGFTSDGERVYCKKQIRIH
ncbi:MAG: hypothetical protein ACK5HT_04120 [Draconibacterium sp.]